MKLMIHNCHTIFENKNITKQKDQTFVHCRNHTLENIIFITFAFQAYPSCIWKQRRCNSKSENQEKDRDSFGLGSHKLRSSQRRVAILPAGNAWRKSQQSFSPSYTSVVDLPLSTPQVVQSRCLHLHNKTWPPISFPFLRSSPPYVSSSSIFHCSLSAPHECINDKLMASYDLSFRH